MGGTQGRDRYREVQSSSTAAPEAPSRGMRGQTGSDGTTKWALVSSKGPRQAHGRHAREMSTAQYGLCDQSQSELDPRIGTVWVLSWKRDRSAKIGERSSVVGSHRYYRCRS